MSDVPSTTKIRYGCEGPEAGGDGVVSGEGRESPLRIVACRRRRSIRRERLQQNSGMQDVTAAVNRLLVTWKVSNGSISYVACENCGSGDSVERKKIPRSFGSTQCASKNQRH